MKQHTPSRRRFLQSTGLSLAAASFAGARAAAQPRLPGPPEKKLGFAIVGLGSLSINQILPAFAHCRHARVTALVSGDAAKAKTLATAYGVPESGIYSYDTYDRLKDNPDVDIVYVVLPNSMHREYTVRAHQAGKHVLCEKPMANTPQDCEAMIAAAKAAGKKLMIGYRLRYEPYNMAMIRMAREQEFGKPKVILCEAGFSIGDPKQWRLNKGLAGGGSLMDIGIYALNAARYLSGEEPIAINAMAYTTPGDVRFADGVEETINFQLRFPSGLLANCVSSYGVGLNRFRVHAEKAAFELEPALSYSDLRMRVIRGGTVEQRTLPDRNQFALEMDHMAECVKTNADPRTPGEEGLKDLRAMMAIYEAARTGKTVTLNA
ncbi:Gfo/Idh/MocA family protein [Luteitalea sp. TBR-22]|uniref:Gfo/Idh/MocA family protein n=1 Tax=Luteitalea sp. TBR-22 TaxID=2802971 RepID=UPI001EF4EE3C|nr:Gfo/Idh/MocA family oxidoreductase [Luteitalea sp. TBR-22]